MPYVYPTVGQIERRLRNLVPAHPNICKIINPPASNRTHNGRQCIVLEIAGPNILDASVRSRVGVLFTGGVHAREWAPPDILLNIAKKFTQAYSSRSGLSFGSKSFTATQIQSIVNNKDLFIFPLVNPDGQNYCRGPPRTAARLRWRKNRRPLPSGSVGVDINRNFDFLFNFRTAFHPSAPVATSDVESDEIYCGSSAFSEAESKNVGWLFDNLTNIRYFVDVHSYAGEILYSWGDDENQTGQPNMNFRNPTYNGSRGIAGDAYREYIPSSDEITARNLATAMGNAIRSSGGRTYTVKQAFDLYPTSGASDDYAYSRKFVDPTKPKVFAFTIECGTRADGGYWPRRDRMLIILNEICAALTQFCLSI